MQNVCTKYIPDLKIPTKDKMLHKQKISTCTKKERKKTNKRQEQEES